MPIGRNLWNSVVCSTITIHPIWVILSDIIGNCAIYTSIYLLSNYYSDKKLNICITQSSRVMKITDALVEIDGIPFSARSLLKLSGSYFCII